MNKTEENRKKLLQHTTIKNQIYRPTIQLNKRKIVAGNLSKARCKKARGNSGKKQTNLFLSSVNRRDHTVTKKSDLVTIVKPPEEKKVKSETACHPAIKIPTAAAFVQERKTVAPQIVHLNPIALNWPCMIMEK